LCDRLRSEHRRGRDASHDRFFGRCDDDVTALLIRRLAEELIAEDAARRCEPDAGDDPYQHRFAHVETLRGLIATVPGHAGGLP
jgi:hypothetical protein